MLQRNLCFPILVFVFGLITVAVIIFPTNTRAEIATVRDWIGLFPVGATDGKTNTVTTPVTATFADGHMWVYANSCAQVPGTSPSLNNAGGCSFAFVSLPQSGNYEFRLYAYDQENPAALISISSARTVATPTPGPGGVVNCPIQNTNPRVQNGLISTPNISGKFGNRDATCVVGSLAPFAPFKIPGYDDLKSIYYTQSKATKDPLNLTSITNATSFSGDVLRSASGNLTVSGNPTGTGTQVIFVDGDLNFNPTGNYCYGSATCPSGAVSGTSGTVFVVKGAVNIDPAITRIDAVIIAAGKIYTAGSGGSGCSQNNVTASQLIVNGSLISLNSSNNIEFCRTLVTGNINPAELINNQPKYLVILRTLYSNNWQKWSEIQ